MMTMNRNLESPWNPGEPASITPEEYEKQVRKSNIKSGEFHLRTCHPCTTKHAVLTVDATVFLHTL